MNHINHGYFQALEKMVFLRNAIYVMLYCDKDHLYITFALTVEILTPPCIDTFNIT